MTEDHTVEKATSEKIESLEKNYGLKVRYLPPPPPEAIVSIFDGKEAFVTISATADLEETPALWSNNSCFVAIIQSYFRDKWKAAHNKVLQPRFES